MAQRTGVYSLIKVAKNMCRLILWADPIIRKKFPTNNALLAALDAAGAACHTLRIQLEAVREEGV